MPVRVRQHQRNGKESLGGHSQRGENRPALKARDSKEIVQARTVIAKAIGCLPNSQQLRVGHISLMDADKKTDVSPNATTVEYGCHNFLLLSLFRLLLLCFFCLLLWLFWLQ